MKKLLQLVFNLFVMIALCSCATDLHYAVLSGNEQRVRAALEADCDIDAGGVANFWNSSNPVSGTALDMAIQERNLSLVRLLIDSGADVNKREPLRTAVGIGSVSFVTLLLEKGAEATARSLCDAAGGAGTNNVAIARLLLDAGVSVDPDKGDSRTPIGQAVERGNTEMARLLVERGADVDREHRRNSPLTIAIYNGWPELVEILINAGASVNQHHRLKMGGDRSAYGRTPLMISVERGTGISGRDNRDLRTNQLAIARTLLEAGADPNIQETVEGDRGFSTSDYGLTALHHAVKAHRNPEFVKLLLEYGADPEIRTNRGKTPLDLAKRSAFGRDELVPLMAPVVEKSRARRRQLGSEILAEAVVEYEKKSRHLSSIGMSREHSRSFMIVTKLWKNLNAEIECDKPPEISSVRERVQQIQARLNSLAELAGKHHSLTLAEARKLLAASELALKGLSDSKARIHSPMICVSAEEAYSNACRILRPSDSAAVIPLEQIIEARGLAQRAISEAQKAERKTQMVLAAQTAATETPHPSAPLVSGYEGANSSGKRYAVLIGINDYEDPQLVDLNYAEQDVKALFSLLKYDSNQGFLEEDIFIMTPGSVRTKDKPTKVNVLMTLKWLNSLKEEDMLLFIFCGHGIEEEGTSYLIPFDGRAALPSDTSIRLSRVFQLLDECPAKQQVVLVDACHSGGVRQGERGARGMKAVSASLTREIVRTGGAEGRAVLAACSSDEVSYEDDSLKHGLFTHYVLRALRNNTADDNKDGRTTVSEIGSYVRREVASWCQKNRRSPVQTPRLFYQDTSGDIQLLKH